MTHLLPSFSLRSAATLSISSLTQREKGGGVAVLAHSNLPVIEKRSSSFQSFEALDIIFQSSSQCLHLILKNQQRIQLPSASLFPNSQRAWKQLYHRLATFYTQVTSIFILWIPTYGIQRSLSTFCILWVYNKMYPNLQ